MIEPPIKIFQPLTGNYCRDTTPLNAIEQPCIHRGKLLDNTTCGCAVFACSLHDTCSTSRRSGLRLCQDCKDYTPGGNNAK